MIATLLLAGATLAPHVVVFDEPGFPSTDGLEAAPAIAGARRVHSGQELAAALDPDHVLVWWHGSSFPAEAWPAFVRFLEGGGSILHLAGEPLTRVVSGPPGARRLGPRTLSLLEVLRLDRAEWIPAAGAEVLAAAGAPAALTVRSLPEGARVSVLEPRFSDTRDFAHEDGAPGSRDAVLVPLAHVHGADGLPFAAAAYAIDRLRGRFAGGRWVLRLLSTPPAPGELEALVALARKPPVDLRVDPLYGSFHAGERPRVRISLHRPGARETVATRVTLRLEGDAGERLEAPDALLSGAEHASVTVPLPAARTPGLYRVKAVVPGRPPVESGFWIRDEELFRSGSTLSFDGYTLLRDGVPEPVIGTTTMSKTVHRDFLFEPNAAAWDDTFGELSGMGVNLVRTGVWSGYRKISLDPHVVDEAWLRALEAYYLTARRHGIPVLFTFFAFVPEAFGGASPYFDPRSLEGQKAYVATVTGRFAGAREIFWDLINEPSFASPDHLWQCRPHGDPFEAAAFRSWLEARHGSGAAPWEEVVRQRWRLRPDEPVGLPTLADFDDAQVFETAHPFRARDWLHFAQDAFRDWALELRAAIRASGSDAAITVGQDEGGLLERPSPLYHADALELTSIHSWWFNDRLVWDAVCAKATGVPLLVSETGVMNREHLSGEAVRSSREEALLCARKLAAAFAGGAFGAVVWCYDTNPYMASDNEVAIGLKRVDGSFTPEHDVLRRFAGFVHRNRARFAGYEEPDVVLLYPKSDDHGARSLRGEGTWRALETLLALGIAPRVVAEHRTAELGRPRAIVLSATRGLDETAWQDVLRAVENGATLVATGWFETDDAGLPAERLRAEPRPLHRREPREDGLVTFPLAVVESWPAARGGPTSRAHGKGRIVHHPLPLEWAEDTRALRRHYASAIDPPAPRIPCTPLPPGVLHREVRFAAATLVVWINESSADVPVIAGSHTLTLAAGDALLAMFDEDGALLDTTQGE